MAQRTNHSRRNLTPYQKAELALALKPLIAAKAEERIEAGIPADPDQKSGPGGTDRELAKAAGAFPDATYRASAAQPGEGRVYG